LKPAERINTVVNLEVPDRVPIAPEIWGDYAARVTGITFYDICSDMKKADYAIEMLLKTYGELDMVYPLFMIRPYKNNWKMSHGQMQYIEEELIGQDLYDEIVQKGYSETYNLKREAATFKAELSSIKPYIVEWEQEREILLYGGVVGISPPLESFSLLRSLNEISIDLFRRPEQIIKASDATIDELIESSMKMAKMAGVPRIFFGSGRCSASFFSPIHYERFVHPYAKRIIQKFAGAGYTIQMHMDGDWTPMFKYFREFPKKKCILHLDGTSDIFKAKEVLGDRMCIMGDVFAPLLSFGSTHDVVKYCRKLIDVCGEGGGYILSSGCTIPMNAKFENVKTMIDMAKTYGVYRK